jgi:hypothetical protein
MKNKKNLRNSKPHGVEGEITKFNVVFWILKQKKGY